MQMSGDLLQLYRFPDTRLFGEIQDGAERISEGFRGHKYKISGRQNYFCPLLTGLTNISSGVDIYQIFPIRKTNIFVH